MFLLVENIVGTVSACNRDKNSLHYAIKTNVVAYVSGLRWKRNTYHVLKATLLQVRDAVSA